MADGAVGAAATALAPPDVKIGNAVGSSPVHFPSCPGLNFVRLVVEEDTFALLAVDCVALEEITTHVLVVVELLLRVRLVAELALDDLFSLILRVAWPYKVYARVEGVLVRQVKPQNRVLRIRTLLMNASEYSTEVVESVVLIRSAQRRDQTQPSGINKLF